MVNRGDLRGRKAENVVAVRAVFLDLDGSPLDPVLTAPTPLRAPTELITWTKAA
jgi:hypothetical protein